MRHIIFAFLALSFALGAADKATAPAGINVPGTKGFPIAADRLNAFHALPPAVENDDYPLLAARVVLGRLLYYDPRLSASQTVSCNSCHPLDKYGADAERVSTGVKGLHGERNSPTVYNSAGHKTQFWDGRAANVEEQAKGPMMNPVEMGMGTQSRVIDTVKSIPEYRDLFSRAFRPQRNPITFDNIAIAIGAFERGLVTPSRWDRFLNGDRTALTEEEVNGFNTFYEAGCASCHNGTYMGGERYEKIGAMKRWPGTHDPGRFSVTRTESDRSVFKVPGLRNVAMTAPYYHDGSVATLDAAVRMMGEYQLGKQLEPAQVNSIIAFLKTLTGQIPAGYIAMPALPPSAPSTPKPTTD